MNQTVLPTYKGLADSTESLVEKLRAIQNNKTDADVQAACEVFLQARAYWEESEAFLYGAATDFGIDPHIDSWPLDLEGLKTALKNTEQINAMAGTDGDVYAGQKLGNSLLGFHGIEYIIFKDGAARPVAEIASLDLIYAIAVAGDLRNRCFQLELAWVGEGKVDDTHFSKVNDDLELPFTVNGGGNSYGEKVQNGRTMFREIGCVSCYRPSWTKGEDNFTDSDGFLKTGDSLLDIVTVCTIAGHVIYLRRLCGMVQPEMMPAGR